MLDPLAKETARLEWHNSLSYLKKFLRQFDFIMIDFIIVCKYSSLSNCKGAGGSKSIAPVGRLSSFIKKGDRVIFRYFPKFSSLTPPP